MMGAYKTSLEKPRCDKCGLYARYSVSNRYNSPVGYFCLKHANDLINTLDRDDREHNIRMKKEK